MASAQFSVTFANRGTPFVFKVATTAIDTTITSLKAGSTTLIQFNEPGTTTPNPASGALVQTAASQKIDGVVWTTVP